MQKVPNKKKIWITWEHHRRSVSLADALHCQYLEVQRPYRFALLNYLRASIVTLAHLLGGRYQYVFVQSPSVVLHFLVAICKPLFRYELIADAHNAIPNYERKRSGILKWMAGVAVRLSDLTIVTNRLLIQPIEKMGGRAYVLPDALPVITPGELPAAFQELKRPLITFICSYAWDEPIEPVLKVASTLSEEFRLVLTGNHTKAPELKKYASQKIHFCGYLSEQEYDALIAQSDFLIDLTVDERILVCGSYEAMAVGVPVMLADTPANRQLFGDAALLCANEPEAYRRAFSEMLEKSADYRERIRAFTQKFQAAWDESFAELKQRVGV